MKKLFGVLLIGSALSLYMTAVPAHAQTSTDERENLPPVITGFTAPTVLTAGQSGNWSVNAYDPEGTALLYSVNWGDSGLPSWLTFLSPNTYGEASLQSHSYSRPGTYLITFRVKDENDLVTKTTASVQVNEPSATATSSPAISDIRIMAGAESAIVSWLTDVNATSRIWMSTSTPIATSSRAAKASSDDFVVTHTLNVAGLTASSTYYAIIGSTDSIGIINYTFPIIFTTSGH